jgi:hypothetical protein
MKSSRNPSPTLSRRAREDHREMRLRADFNRLDQHGHLRLTGLATHGSSPFSLLAQLDAIEFYQGGEQVRGHLIREPEVGWVGVVDWASLEEISDPLAIGETRPAPLAWIIRIGTSLGLVGPTPVAEAPRPLPVMTAGHQASGAMLIPQTGIQHLILTFDRDQALQLDQASEILAGNTTPAVPPWMINRLSLGRVGRHG